MYVTRWTYFIWFVLLCSNIISTNTKQATHIRWQPLQMLDWVSHISIHIQSQWGNMDNSKIFMFIICLIIHIKILQTRNERKLPSVCVRCSFLNFHKKTWHFFFSVQLSYKFFSFFMYNFQKIGWIMIVPKPLTWNTNMLFFYNVLQYWCRWTKFTPWILPTELDHIPNLL